ncbi:ABC-2 type transport system permease protein [Microbacterium testaceum]|uniref:ABC transporter permease n=1 Tax=Microbacterium TaxID=33882 RepID=UPI001AE98ACD|nr:MULTISPECIES: ABC transporter permease [Microbacterium]MDQ1112990.1 ABC-2 type transport system permease protein [Microbacterium testaceum]MDR6096471.1 ABC-2 type transport system permease protein [Microbacterium sp. SORGH_AS_0454]
MASPSPAANNARFTRLAEMPMRSVGVTPGLGLASLWTTLRDIFARREMLDLLVKRDVKARYKDSALGFVWALIRPLILLGIYFVVLGQFLGAAKGIPDFAIFIFTGLTAMSLFQEIAVGGTGSIIANGGVVKKVYMPREIFPLAATGSAIFNFAIQLGVLLVATIIAAKPPLHWQIVYAVPSLVLILVYGLAFAFFFSAINVYLRDVQYLVEVVTMLLMWLSPVLYAWQMARQIINNPVLLEVYTNNPLTLAVLGFQRAFWLAGDTLEQPAHLVLRMGVALLIGLVLLVLSHRVFVRLQGNFAQEL